MNLSDILDKIEPYLTQEELALVGQMETSLEEAKDMALTNDNLEGEVMALRRSVGDLEEEIDELKSDNESLKLFRNPSNWDGNKFIPVLHYQRGDDPWNL